MGKVDKTKENINVTGLDDRSRKELFEKFVDAGGKVVSDREERRRNATSKPVKQSSTTAGKPSGKSHSSVSKSRSPRASSTTTGHGSVQKASPATEQKAGSSFLDMFLLRLRLALGRTVKFNGSYFNVNFLKAIHERYNPALMELQIMYYELYRNNPSLKKNLLEEMDRLNPLYYELVEMCGEIYDRMSMDEITHHYRNFPEMPQSLNELKDRLMILFRKLYILYPHHNAVLMAYERSVDEALKIVGKNPRIAAMKRKARTELAEIFNSLLPRLHLLFCWYQNRYFEITNPAIEKVLGITQADKPGKRELVKPGEDIEEERPTQEKDETEREEDQVDEHARKGLEMMYQINLREMRLLHDRNNKYQVFPDNDKVLMTFLFFSVFDDEFSTIFTNSAIKYREEVARDGSRIDYHKLMNDFYDEMRKCYRAIDAYLDGYETYEKARRQRPVGNTQHIEYTKRLESLKKKLINLGKTARSTILDYLGQVRKVVVNINEDLEGPQRIIQNPQDELEFNTQVEGMKRLHKKKIYDAFLIVTSYIAALEYRLGPTGDLGGSALTTNETEVPEQPEVETEKPQGKKEDESQGSILSELDDLL